MSRLDSEIRNQEFLLELLNKHKERLVMLGLVDDAKAIYDSVIFTKQTIDRLKRDKKNCESSQGKMGL